MLINLSEVFTLEGKEKTWEVPFEAKAYKGTRVEYPVVSANPVKITVKNLGNRHLSLTGNTSVTLAIPCSRCLEPVNYTTDIEFDQEIDMNASDEDRVKDLDEQSYLSGYNLGSAANVEQISTKEIAAVIHGFLTRGWQPSRIFSNSLRRCNHVYLS